MAVLLVSLLAGCGSRAPLSGRDGPEANPPSRLAEVPDAEPRIEPIRSGGPNRPYEVLGRNYVPITQDRAFRERGLASWYGKKFHGRRTANGEVYDMYAMTAAHPTLPLPSYARIRNPANGREIIVRVNDRGPFHKGRIVDLSYTAALKLDLLRGVAPVELERITFAEIRSGAWRRDRPVPDLPDPAPAPAIAAVPLEAPPLPAAAAAPEPEGPALRPLASAPRGFWIQLGAFRQRDGAESFQRRVADELDWLSPLLAVFVDTPLFRLQAGPYASREEASEGAERIREALQLVPVIVERR
ncbi:septal ring lytic transglycosylase RlpA family protein [Variovorax sp. YR752]|uniref:septal ring lytic transglycosylase RlpA family protein n=1 Tax=Variovorax sp. YR752 TaxID=1884383 RepID=UPI003137E6F9